MQRSPVTRLNRPRSSIERLSKTRRAPIFQPTPGVTLSLAGHTALITGGSRGIGAGEPFQLFFTPKEIAAELTAFYSLEDLDSSEINARYFPHPTQHLHTRGSAGHLLSAWL